MSWRSGTLTVLVVATFIVATFWDPAPAGDPADYPPTKVDDLAAVLEPQLAEFGATLTRGGLVDRSDGYRPSRTGTHLALYVRRDGAGVDEYVADLAPMAVAFGKVVFDRWPAVDTFDICQEPLPDGHEDAGGFTQVDISRDAFALVDDADLDLAALLAVDRRRDDVVVAATDPVVEHPAFATARETSEIPSGDPAPG